MGRLQTSHLEAGGAEAARVGSSSSSGSGFGFGSDGIVVWGRGSFGRTMERYLLAMFVPASGVCCALVDVDVVVVLSSCSEDRTKGTRFRFMPAPKTRWSSSGRK